MTKHEILKRISTPGNSQTLWDITQTGQHEYEIAPSHSPAARRIARHCGLIGVELSADKIREFMA